MSCLYCKNSSMHDAVTTFMANVDDCLIVVKNVPCLECDQCGEQYYTHEVSKALDAIVNRAKEVLSEVTIIDYQKAA